MICISMQVVYHTTVINFRCGMFSALSCAYTIDMHSDRKKEKHIEYFHKK